MYNVKNINNQNCTAVYGMVNSVIKCLADKMIKSFLTEKTFV